MANDTNSSEMDLGHKTMIALAVAVPLSFAVLLLALLLVTWLMPRYLEPQESPEERQAKRIEKLEHSVKAKLFAEWAKEERQKSPGGRYDDVLCVICLEDFEDSSQIRGLGCHHVFHQACLDDWFGRCHEYCPLCHRPIIPGKPQAKKIRVRSEPWTSMV